LESNRFSQYPQRDIDYFQWRIEVPYIYNRTQKLFNLIFQDRPKAVLEVGCGEGITLYHINPIKYVGIDNSLVRLRAASIQFKDRTFIQGDGTSLPIGSEKFDLVFCMGTLHHLSGPGAFLMIQEMGRVCKKGGWVAIIEPNVFNFFSFLLALLRKPERGIFRSKPKVFLKYFRQLGMGYEIKLTYDGIFSAIDLLRFFFKKKKFIKAPWFNRLCERIEDISNKIIPERFWAIMVILGRKE